MIYCMFINSVPYSDCGNSEILEILITVSSNISKRYLHLKYDLKNKFLFRNDDHRKDHDASNQSSAIRGSIETTSTVPILSWSGNDILIRIALDEIAISVTDNNSVYGNRLVRMELI